MPTTRTQKKFRGNSPVNSVSKRRKLTDSPKKDEFRNKNKENRILAESRSEASTYSSGSDLDEEETLEKLKYEEIRQKNLKDNAAFFSKLGIHKLKQEMANNSRPKNKPKPSARGLKVERHRSPPVRRQPSLRIRKLDPDGAPLPPELLQLPTVEEHPRVKSGPLRMSESVWSNTDDVIQERFMRRVKQNVNRNASVQFIYDKQHKVQSGPFSMSDSICSKTDTSDQERFIGKVKNTVQKNSESGTVQDTKTPRKKISENNNARVDEFIPNTAQSSPLSQVISEFSNLRLQEKCVAKVVPNRIFSIAIHHTEDMVLVAAGGKWGKIGLWDVEEAEKCEGDGVIAYGVHSSPVNCLLFSRHFPHQMYSCSYDGTLRCADFTTAIIDEIYCAPKVQSTMLRNFDFLSPYNLIVSQSDGCIAVIDTRTEGTKAEHIYEVHNKPLRTVSAHPVQTHHLATASVDGSVCLWDLRKLHKTKNDSLETLPHGRTVNSAYFSPITGNKILTTSLDNTICIYDSSSPSFDVKLKQSVKHDNFVGRWLTQFRATWHPTREDFWVVGSMARPRQIELYNDNGKMVSVLKDMDYLASVCSLNCIHPTRNILAGGNSSGRVHVFM